MYVVRGTAPAPARTHSQHLVEWCAGCLIFIGYGQTVSSCLRALVGARVGSARPPDRLCNLMPLEVARFLPVAHPPPPIRPSFVAANSPPPPLGRRRQLCVGGWSGKCVCPTVLPPPPPDDRKWRSGKALATSGRSVRFPASIGALKQNERISRWLQLLAPPSARTCPSSFFFFL